MISDLELISRVLVSDDRGAFGELVVRHQSAVRHFLRHLTKGNATLADDLAQETFVHAYRALRHFRGDASFSTWLFGIAYNHLRNARRSQRNHAELNDQTPDSAANEAIHETDLRHDLAVAMRELSRDEQLAIHLGFYQGKSHGEIAALLEWPLGTVKTHIARAKEKLRHPLSAWNPHV